MFLLGFTGFYRVSTRRPGVVPVSKTASGLSQCWPGSNRFYRLVATGLLVASEFQRVLTQFVLT